MSEIFIYDKDLIGIDPLNPNLSLEIKNKIVEECKRNFGYFAKEVMRISYEDEKIELNKSKIDLINMINGKGRGDNICQ